MSISVCNTLLLYLGITSLHLISGYAWSGRLENPDDFLLSLHEECAQDSKEDYVTEYNEVNTTFVQGESRQSASVRGVPKPDCNFVFDKENEAELRELYDIQ
jgi:hypothetical protein